MQSPFEPRETFLYSPNEPAAAAPPETPAAPAAQAAPVSEATTASTPQAPQAAQSSVADTSSGAASATPTATPAAPSWLEGFKSEGVSFSDENQAKQQLLQSYRDAERLRPLAPALSAYQQHAGEFHKWLSDKQKSPASPASQEDWTKKLGWNHPEWNPNWQHQITKDAQGNLIPLPGAPADVVLKYQQATQFRQEFIDQFLMNPAKTLEPYMRHVAQEIASQQSQQGVGQFREQQEANQFIEKNSNWLFDKGTDGGVKTRSVLNPQTGRYESEKVLSQWGGMFVQKLQQGAQRGLPPDLQQEFAMQAVQNAYMATPEYITWASSQGQPAAPPAAAAAAATPTQASPRQAANDAFTKRANPAAPPTAQSGGNSKAAPRTVNRNNLEEIMLERFREAGITNF